MGFAVMGCYHSSTPNSKSLCPSVLFNTATNTSLTYYFTIVKCVSCIGIILFSESVCKRLNNSHSILLSGNKIYSTFYLGAQTVQDLSNKTTFLNSGRLTFHVCRRNSVGYQYIDCETRTKINRSDYHINGSVISLI
jgi:hypothetical protein